MHKGQLKNWEDDKWYVFIQSSDLNQCTFIHISSSKGMSRKPKTSDYIYLVVKNQINCKTKAINCFIEKLAAKSLQRHKPRIYRNTSAPKSKLVLIGIGVFSFQRLGLAPSNTPARQKTPNISMPIPNFRVTAPNDISRRSRVLH